MKRTKIVSALLAALLALSCAGSLTSCIKAKSAEPPKEKRTNVYAGETITLPDEVSYVQSVSASDGRAYVTYEAEFTALYNDVGEIVEKTPGYNWEEVEKKNESLPEGWWYSYNYENMLMTVDLETGETSSVPFTVDEEAYGWAYNWAPGPDGTLVARSQLWNYDPETDMSTSTNYLLFLDPVTAEVTKSVDLTTPLKKAGINTDNTYINTIIPTSNSIYVSSDNDVFLLDAEGNYKSTVPLNLNDGWTQGMWQVGDRLVIAVYTGGRQSLKMIENGQLTDINSEALKAASSSSPAFADDNNLYYNSSTGIYAYNFETDTYGEVLNYINSDIDQTGSLAFLPDGRIVMAVRDWEMDNPSTTLSILHRVPDEELAEEIILRLGCLYVDYYLRKAVIRYNKLNTGIRVTMVDYSSYNNEDNEWTGALTQFNNDITSGKIPDMVLLSTDMPVESYLRKSIFVDLNKYIDDPEKGISRSEVLDNVWRASETGGKLNSMILTFNLYTLIAKSEIVGTEPGWTFEEMMTAIHSMPEGARAFFDYGRDSILLNFFNYSMGSFIDWESGKTYFDTPGFIDFVNYLATCPEKGYWEELYGDNYEYDPEREREFEEEFAMRFKRNMALFQMGWYYDFTSFLESRNEFGTKDITAIGYPREGEGNGAVIVPAIELAISSKSPAKEQAWEVLKNLLGDTQLAKESGLSVSRAGLNERYEKAKENYGDYMVFEDSDYDWYREAGYSEEYIEMQKNRRQPYDQAAVDYMWDLIENASLVARTDSSLVEIINEELSAVFAGAKSADVAAKQIASRVGIYVSEHS
ncbi:MAG: extracellular solute-binding protein [Clostridia bacterium]|nr:extracellular solute-binding protein [Clostridia bacterium]